MMYNAYVPESVTSITKRPLTNHASERFFSSVYSHVLGVVRFEFAYVATEVALPFSHKSKSGFNGRGGTPEIKRGRIWRKPINGVNLQSLS